MRINRNDVDNWLEYEIDLTNRTVNIIGDIDELTFQRVAKAYHLFSSSRIDERVRIYLNSAGGSVTDGLAIYDIIKAAPFDTQILVTGEACSIAAVILQAATTRVITKHSSMMIHIGTIELPDDHPRNSKARLQFSDKQDIWIRDILLQRIQERNPDVTKATLTKWLDFDKYMTAAEAVKLGLIDEVIE